MEAPEIESSVKPNFQINFVQPIAGLRAPRGAQQRAPPAGRREERQEPGRVQGVAGDDEQRRASSRQRGTVSKSDDGRVLDWISLVQGGPSGGTLPLVDIKTKDPSQYTEWGGRLSKRFCKQISDSSPCSALAAAVLAQQPM